MFIVIYGIYPGIFSPTEAAAITVGFCLLAGLLITHEIKFKELPDILLRSGQLLGMLGTAEVVSSFVAWFGDSSTVVLLVCTAIAMAAGYILENLPVTVIFAPILAPIAVAHGVDPVHFSVIFLVGAAIGFITPPFGLNLFVISGIPYAKLIRFATMYLVGLVIAWLLIAFVPWFSLGLLPSAGR